jgi:sarcosine oxidase subunit gamma
MPEGTQMSSVPNKTSVVQITTMTFRTSLRLKSWLPQHTNGVKPVVLAGRQLPLQVGATLPASPRVLCVGPGEWLVVSYARQALELREDIEPALSRQGLVLVDLTHGLSGLDVRGSAAREVLSKGSGLDFHPRSFPVDRCARTRLAQIPVVIDCLDASPRFELYVARSYFQYLHSWIFDAASEFENA